MLYWTVAASAGGSYGDIRAVGRYEKIFEIIIIILFRVYISFVAAEITTLFASKIAKKWDYLEKFN